MTALQTADATVGKTYDAIVIGAGHNGLVCANYLARAGMKVLVLERRPCGGRGGGDGGDRAGVPGPRSSPTS